MAKYGGMNGSRARDAHRFRGTRIAVALVACLVTAACGTQLPDEAFTPTTQVVSTDGGAAVSDSTGPQPGQAVAATPGSDGAPNGDDTATTTPVVDAGDTGGGSPSPGEQAAPTGPSGDTSGSTDGGTSSASRGPNQASDVGITPTVIRLGNITAENGVLGDTFAPAVRGLRAWVAATNAKGGIGGRQIELYTCDDREDRARSLECARRLVEQDQVFALVATNSRSLGGAAQYLADQNVPVIGFPISNSFYRYPNFFTIYGTGYARDGKTVGKGGKIITQSGQYRWFKEHLGVTKAAVFNYDINESSQAGDQFVAGLESEGFSVTQYTVSFAAPSFDQAVADMQKRGTEIIFDAMDDGANRRLCDSMTRRKFQPKAKVSTVVILGDGVGSKYDATCRNIIFSPTESVPYTSDVPEVVEFRNAYARYQPGLPLHQWAMEAWAMGNIAADAIESMGPAPTRDGFIQYLDTMPANDAGGIMVGTDFRPSSYHYDAATAKDCFAIARFQQSQGGWVAASSPFPFCYPDAHNVATTAREQGN